MGICAGFIRAGNWKKPAGTAWIFFGLLGDEKAPDHSTLARFRTGRSREALEGLFYQLVRKLEKIGEVDHRAVFVDGTKLESRAGRYTFVWRKSVEKQLDRVKEQVRQQTGLTTAAALAPHLEGAAQGIQFVHGSGKREESRAEELGDSAPSVGGVGRRMSGS